MKKLSLLMIIVLFVSCASLQKQSVCNDPAAEQSIICGILYDSGIAAPEQADVLLQIVSLIYLEKNPEKRADTLEFINEALDLLHHGITHKIFANYILHEMPITLKIAVTGILQEMVTFDVPINEFDKALIRRHLEKQRDIIESLDRGCKRRSLGLFIESLGV